MKAQQLLDERVPQGDGSFAELRIWKVSSPVPGSFHTLKYSLAFVVREVCMAFTTPAALIADFWRDVDILKGLK